jgi:hypothetical protein
LVVQPHQAKTQRISGMKLNSGAITLWAIRFALPQSRKGVTAEVVQRAALLQKLRCRKAASPRKGEAFGRRIVSGASRYATKSKIKPFP